MANGRPPGTTLRVVISCTSDAEALAKLPKMRPDVELVQHGPGGQTELRTVGRPPETWFPQHLQPRAGNQVVAYIFGRCFFLDVGAALATATTEEHRIYLLGWDGEKGTELTPGKTLEYYLSNTKAQIRAMFHDGIVARSPAPLIPPIRSQDAPGSPWLSKLINDLGHGGSLIDTKHASPATHHQKILVVQGSQGVIAFIGGMDIVQNRAHVDPRSGEPWHDVHVRITGPGAMDCRAVFQERWSDHPGSEPLDRKLGSRDRDAFPPPAASQEVPSVTTPTGIPRPPARSVRIGRTYPKLRRWGGGADFSFAPQGIYTAWDLIEYGIRTTKRFIYIEDQYMVSRMARRLLLEKLKEPEFQFLLILMRTSLTGDTADARKNTDIPWMVAERNYFREDLKAIDKSMSKWGIYRLAAPADPERQKWCGTYVHSKTWIFDDEYAIVGSANCENRGYTLATEAVAGIADSVTTTAAGQGFARSLRIALWHKHLGVPHADVRDWRQGLSLWAKPPASAMIERSDAIETDPYLFGKAFPEASDKAMYETVWTTIIDPDAR